MTAAEPRAHNAGNPSMPGDFQEALKAGDASPVQAYLDDDPSLAGAQTESGLSALLVATYYGAPAVAKLLIERGAEVDVFAAAALGRLDDLRVLLASGPGAPDPGHPRLIDTYSPDGWTPLHLAAHFGRLDAAALLLDAGAGVTAQSRNGMQNMPLHAALASRHRDVAALLLDRGAEVNARQHGGFTPLHAAAQNGDLPSSTLLLDRGADPNATTDDGRTPLWYAEKGGHTAVAGLLHSHGASA
ncbi:MAG: ankyrin repeat domain-containing protein [Chloroflexota bacterium]|nr:ankyrin repeat domain-containing protein [Chloroflexota bacterium]